MGPAQKTSPPTPGAVPGDKAFELAASYAWDWFSLHSAQRMQLINSLIASLALTVAGYATTAAFKRWWVAAAVALAGIILSFVFQRLDVRTRELVQVSEPALEEIESRLRASSGVTALSFVPVVQRPRSWLNTYRTSLRILTGSAMVLFGLGLILAMIEALTLSSGGIPTPSPTP